MLNYAYFSGDAAVSCIEVDEPL